MGNAAGKLTPCFCPAGEISRRHDIAVVLGNPLDEGLGHSFCYIRPDPFGLKPSSMGLGQGQGQTATLFHTISGASISANTSTPLSTSLLLFDPYPSSYAMDRASSFESSPSFASVPLQPIPRIIRNRIINSGPLPSGSGPMMGSGPIERGFLSGPIERSLTSGPIDHHRNMEETIIKSKYKFNKWGSIKGIKDSILGALSLSLSLWGGGGEKSGYDPIKEKEYIHNHESLGKSSSVCSLFDENEEAASAAGADQESNHLQWAQGKAGEDRVHVVVSEDNGWVFVGIYDGFNGPDAPDFLLSNLYSAVHKELKGLHLWSDEGKSELELELDSSLGNKNQLDEEMNNNNSLRRFSGMDCSSSSSSLCGDQENCCEKKQRGNYGNSNSNMLELDDRIKEKMKQMASNNNNNNNNKIKHSDVLKALSDGLRKTEEAYLEIADKMVKENPELCLMGSCVLVMLMMGEDIYLMNVGDSRAVLASAAQKAADLDDFPNITSLQLTMDHNTCVKEEVRRIRKEHPDDPLALVNHRVKGSLKVTRAFGAGFLKQRKWNDALLEMFRIDYVGSRPYITCNPSLYHHKVGPTDKFLILSSDGLYQYFTNQEAVSEVELFMASTPEGDPAQHLVEQVLIRAAKKAGMDFHELLEIPQGERRRYHDDVSAIIISLEGTIWRSSL